MVTPNVLQVFYSVVEKTLREVGILAGKSGRHMKFPYTLSAKIAQFPMFHYMKYNNIWMYYPLGWVVGFYLFSKIHNVVNSDANVRSWAESQRKIAEKEAHH
ncbi:uncharacterized protein LOC125227819 [Leguminivora glycinivorella]|uniref:uncharacterized protein LOC125227819 n=1 Tax=Leguminivora glycinivorella TaxID=1035111 RepID=UPI00201038A7|nr:uncharacterized protein LOC125227819 [Leguminivora glycinivorella]